MLVVEILTERFFLSFFNIKLASVTQCNRYLKKSAKIGRYCVAKEFFRNKQNVIFIYFTLCICIYLDKICIIGIL